MIKSGFREDIMRIMLAAVFTLIPISFSYAADCQVAPYNFHFGTDSSTTMTVKSGKTCGSNVRVRAGGLSSLQIGQAAQNGTASTIGTSRWEYRSRPGFNGKDAFVVQMSGESMGTRRVSNGTTNISVDVDVTP